MGLQTLKATSATANRAYNTNSNEGYSNTNMQPNSNGNISDYSSNNRNRNEGYSSTNKVIRKKSTKIESKNSINKNNTTKMFPKKEQTSNTKKPNKFKALFEKQSDTNEFTKFTLEKNLEIIIPKPDKRSLLEKVFKSQVELVNQYTIDSQNKKYIHDYRKPFYDID